MSVIDDLNWEGPPDDEYGRPAFTQRGEDWEPDEPSLSLIAKWHDEGRTCSECACEFTKANGEPSCCQFCKNNGSTLPLSQHPEKNVEAHKERARKRRKARRSS